MFVSILSDDVGKEREIGLILARHHTLTNAAQTGASAADSAIVVDYDMRNVAAVDGLRTVVGSLDNGCKKIFVVPEKSRWFVAQACALGAPHVVARPLSSDDLLRSLASKQIPGSDESLLQDGLSGEMNQSAAAFRSMFAAVAQVADVDVGKAKTATGMIIKGVSRRGLASWLDDVRHHHHGTFQHCLIVAGVAVGFALSMNFATADVERLGLAATLHDVGKARVPVAILDKPGKLDAAEEEIVRRHPRFGYDALVDVQDLDPVVLDAVLHHHEFLDGSGYPDRISGSAIPDIVRLLTISDVFGTLIEDRYYRPAMPAQRAYSILQSMEGKLEVALVKAFRNVAGVL